MRSKQSNKAWYTKISNYSASRAIYLRERTEFALARTHSFVVQDTSRASVVHHVDDEEAAVGLLLHHAIMRVDLGSTIKRLDLGALLMELSLTENVAGMLLATHRSTKG